jgi:hypothetical protein
MKKKPKATAQSVIQEVTRYVNKHAQVDPLTLPFYGGYGPVRTIDPDDLLAHLEKKFGAARRGRK